MPKVIDSFDLEYNFLSNFYPCFVTYKGITYQSSEAAFHAQKTLDIHERVKFTLLNPSQSKKAGRALQLRDDWEEVKYEIMYDIVLQKFVQNEWIQQKLLATDDAELIEGNWWGDTYWGVCKGVGENNLGKILMDVREYLRSVQSALLTLAVCKESDDAELQ